MSVCPCINNIVDGHTDMHSKIYLYIKIHNITGLKYFGKTTQDPYSYPGSGKYWKRHLKKYGNDVKTRIYGEYVDKNKCLIDALEFSKKNNIVESKEWANIIEEALDGGDTSKSIGYINSKYKIKEYSKKCKWWNNGIEQKFCPSPPDNTYVNGRLSFNNAGAKIGSDIQRGKIWVNNGISEMMVQSNNIPDGYKKGRLLSKVFKIRYNATGSYWWNNGIVECMSKKQPDDSFKKGRLKR